MPLRYALLLDAGFLKYQLGSASKPIDGEDVEAFVEKVKALPLLEGMRLHRIYVYDAKPLTGTDVNPADGSSVDFGATDSSSRNRRLHEHLSRLPFFSLRFGELHQEGWAIKKKPMDRARRNPGPFTVEGKDLRPQVRQKGVDMRIGLDIASLTLKKHVDVIVLATGDSDFVPAMKFARREGAQLILVTCGKGVREGMREHADVVVESL